MDKFVAQVAFASLMLILGLAALLSPDEIRSAMLKVIGPRRGWFGSISPTQAIWNIRCGGAIAVLMGMFVLWVSWRSH